MKLSLRTLLPLLSLLFFALLAEWLVQKNFIPRYLFPAPSDLFRALEESPQEFLQAALSTTKNSLLGLLIACALGISFAFLLSISKWMEAAFAPYAIFFQTVPIIAIAPLLVIWLGFGDITVIVSSLIVCIFPIIANTLAGIHATDPALLDLFRLYNKRSNLITLIKLRLPYAMPSIYTGIRIATGLSLIGAIVGEFIAGSGLGGLIDMARTQQRIDKVFAAVFIASFVGIIFVSILRLLAYVFLKRWHRMIEN